MSSPFLVRFKAFMIDYIIIFIYLFIIFSLGVLFPTIQELFKGSLIVAQFTGFVLVTLPISLYFVISDSKLSGGSLGKRKMGIRVVGKEGNAISIPRAIFRTILKFFPWELSHFLAYRLMDLGDNPLPLSYYLIGGLVYLLVFVYILFAIFTRKKQSLYDILAKTQVVKSSL